MYWVERLLSGEKNPAANTKLGFALVIVTPVFLISCGRARSGYSEIGKLGMETAPARMISRAQTVAKIGRLMKKSTKPALLLPAAPLCGGSVHFRRSC